ncbi:MAG: Eco57I restriction-modification methylase domain-containing protein [Gammaproteobacteria bacterium]
MPNVKTLGQVFTPLPVVEKMLALRRNFGSVLEPSAGNGAFFDRIQNCTGIEICHAHCKSGMRRMDFFDLPESEKFDTIIGNPPFVRWRDICPQTRAKLPHALFDRRSNLYLFFIGKCLRHLRPGGELIFITPRDFIKATAARKLNAFLYESGTITDFDDMGDARIFGDYAPNCAIWRFEKDDFCRRTNGGRRFSLVDGQLIFADAAGVLCRDIFRVKVGAVSGMDSVFSSERFGNADFVCSHTRTTGKTRRMIFNAMHKSLLPHKGALIRRRIRRFGENDWWQWGRMHHISDAPRVYVNAKTRRAAPFFTHPCRNYDGSVLALFPRDAAADVAQLAEVLNRVDWRDLGFVCGGRFIFSQRALSSVPLSF